MNKIFIHSFIYSSIRRRILLALFVVYDYNSHSFHSYSFISTTLDKTQLNNRAKIKRDGDRTEKKVSVIYMNYQILELEQLQYHIDM